MLLWREEEEKDYLLAFPSRGAYRACAYDASGGGYTNRKQ